MAENKSDNPKQQQGEQRKPGTEGSGKPNIFNSSSEYIIDIDADLVNASDPKIVVMQDANGIHIHLGVFTGGMHAFEHRTPPDGPAKTVVMHLTSKKES